MYANTSPLVDFLEGYKLVEWPNLSSDRNPAHVAHYASVPLGDGTVSSGIAFHAAILVAIGRIVGAYCGASDVLLGAQFNLGETRYRVIRVAWDQGKTWEQALSSVEAQLEGPPDNNLVHLDAVRKALGLTDNQMPCLALYSLSSGGVEPTGFPFAVSFDDSTSMLHLASWKTTLHPSFSSLILAQLVSILGNIPLDAKTSMLEVPDLPSQLLSISERDLSRHSTDSPPNFVMDYLTSQARNSPDSVAFYWCPGHPQSSHPPPMADSMSYQDWHIRSNKLGHWLIQRGLEKEDRVAVCMQRDRHFHIAMMAIMRAGGCYVPIDPELPSERKKYIASDSEARFVLTSKALSSPLLFENKTIFIEDPAVQDEISRQPADNIVLASSDSLAYLLYTSGTTGNPKGCLITHEGFTEAIWTITNIVLQTPYDDVEGRYLATASIAFDVHLAEVFVSLAMGIPLYNVPRSVLLENLPYYVMELGITHLGIVPSLMEATLSVAQEEGDLEGMKLRYIASGGEKITDAILDKWAEHPKFRLANFYGPSEVTIGCCARYMDASSPKSNIGKTWSNVSGYVVDENMNIVIRGGVGELVVGGPLVGRGYHGRPDLTEKVFLEWPKKGQKAYRTGDLVRMMPDSTVEIIGRIDTQIKLRGVRIESEGISSIVRKAAPPSPRFSLDAMTILANHPKIGTDQLVTFIAWDPTVSVSVRKASLPDVAKPPPGLLQAIKKVCDAELASYMRPSHVIPLTWLPLSSNGKTDAKSLTRIFTGLELTVIANLLPRGEDDGRTQKEGSEPLAALSTPTQGTSYVDTFSARWLPEILREYRVQDVECILPAFPMQEGVLSRAAVDNTLYVQSVILACKSQTSLEKIKRAWEVVMSRHQILRAVFYFGSSLVQVVLRPYTHPLPWVEKKMPSVRDSEFSQWFAKSEAMEIARSINDHISDKPLFQLTAYTSSTGSYVVLSLHHTLFDGSSLPILLEEVREVYLGLPTSLPTPLPNILNAIAAANVEKARGFWCNMFERFSWPPSPFQRSEPSGWEKLIVPFETSLSCLRNAAARAQITLQALLTRTFAEMLASRIYNCSDITFGTIRSGRLQAIDGIETAICPTISVHPFRVNLKKGDTLSHIQQNIVDAFEFEHIGLGQIQAWVRPGLPLFDVVFSLSVESRINNELWEMVESQNPLPDFPLAVEAFLDPEHDSLCMRAAWISGAIADQIVHDFLRSFEATTLRFAGLVADVQSSPSTRSSSTLCDTDASPNLTTTPTNIAPAITLNRLRSIISRFMNTDESLLRDDTSLISLGLDSLKSVGLSRVLRREGINISATQLMTSSTIRKLADLLHPLTADEDDSHVDATSRLRSIISEFLSVNESLIVGDTSLISLGLDSLKSVGLSRALRRKGINISATQLLTSGSIRKLADLLGSVGSVDEQKTVSVVEVTKHGQVEDTFHQAVGSIDANSLKLGAGDRVRILPVTDLQAGMLSQTISSRGRLYVYAFPLRLAKHVDILSLQAAWKRAVALLSILRTSFTFSSEHGVWFQVIHSLEILDWSTDSFTDEVAYSEKVAALAASFDLLDELAFHRPPFRIRLYSSSSSPSDKRLVIAMHHALYDGISFGKLLDVVASLYRGVNLPPLIQFVDLLPIIKRQERLGTDFWVEVLRGYTKVDLPRITSPTEQTSGALHISSEIVKFDPLVLTFLLSGLSITVQCIAQAALSKLLSLKLDTSDVLFGHVVSGRGISEGEDVIGPLLNTIPCRIQVPHGVQNDELLKAVHTWNIAALPHQQLSLRSLQKALGLQSLWDVLFVFQPLQPAESPADSLWEFDTSMGEGFDAKVQYPWTIEIHQHVDHFVVGGICRAEYMDANDFAATMRQLADLVSELIHIPQTTKVPSTLVPAQRDSGLPTTLLQLLANTTGLPSNQITPQTPLAALGIDSITAIQLAARCRKLGLRILVSDISSSNTIGELVTKISPPDSMPINKIPTSMVYITVSASEASLIKAQSGWDTTDAIERITIASPGMKWLIGGWQRSQGTRFQHVFAYRLSANIDPVKLRRAWFALVARHDILRSTFACEDDSSEPRLATFKADAFKDHWSEERLPSRAFFRCALEKIKSLVVSPPSVHRPPTHALLLSSSKFSYLVVHLHHFQYDAWSLQLLMEDLSRLYYGEEPMASNDLRSFLAHSTPDNNMLETQKEYWKEMFPSTFRPVYFPRLTRKPALSPQRTICTVPVALGKASLCEQRARTLGVSMQAIFLASWAELQAQYTSHTDATFGLWHAGRKGALEGIEQLAVPCMNVLPLRVSDVKTLSILMTAKRIEEALKKRTAVIEQSDLERVDEWVAGKGRALCNVFVNIVKVAAEVKKENSLLEPVHIPYWVPSALQCEDDTLIPRLSITELIRDDLMIDIVMLEKQDSVLMSVDASVSMMNEEQAKEVVDRWAIIAKGVLGVV